MPDRRGSRFLLEALFLAGLAAALAVARLRTSEIAGAMLLGWALVAALEWVAWRGRPHYGSGLPPRYYVPRLNLPPPLPVPGVPASGFLRGAHDEERTWVPQPATRREVLGDWPLAAPGTGDARREPPESDPWLVASLPVAPIERQSAATAGSSGSTAAEPAEQVVAVATWSTVVAAKARRGPMAQHSLDPLAEPTRRKRGTAGEEVLRVEVPARPPGIRPLPSRWKR